MKKRRILAIFDGSNFYHLAKNLSPKTHLTDFNYRKFVEKLTGETKIQIEYCVGEIKKRKHDKKSEKLYAGQQLLFENLRRQDILIKLGFMLNTKGVWHEKGVDVRIATDILKGAFKHEYDVCYIISSDSDLIPAIVEVKSTGRKIVYVGFDHFVSLAMQKNCSRQILITKKLIESI